jgi:hypothetical protein
VDPPDPCFLSSEPSVRAGAASPAFVPSRSSRCAVAAPAAIRLVFQGPGRELVRKRNSQFNHLNDKVVTYVASVSSYRTAPGAPHSAKATLLSSAAPCALFRFCSSPRCASGLVVNVHDGPQRVDEDDHDHGDCGMRRRPSGDIKPPPPPTPSSSSSACVRWCQQA